jgi:hypothetical protein
MFLLVNNKKYLSLSYKRKPEITYEGLRLSSFLGEAIGSLYVALIENATKRSACSG